MPVSLWNIFVFILGKSDEMEGGDVCAAEVISLVVDSGGSLNRIAFVGDFFRRKEGSESISQEPVQLQHTNLAFAICLEETAMS